MTEPLTCSIRYDAETERVVLSLSTGDVEAGREAWLQQRAEALAAVQARIADAESDISFLEQELGMGMITDQEEIDRKTAELAGKYEDLAAAQADERTLQQGEAYDPERDAAHVVTLTGTEAQELAGVIGLAAGTAGRLSVAYETAGLGAITVASEGNGEAVETAWTEDVTTTWTPSAARAQIEGLIQAAGMV